MTVEGYKNIRVWVTGTQDIDFINSVREAVNTDIIIHFDNFKNRITKIAGYKNRSSDLSNEVMVIDKRELNSYISNFYSIERGEYILLSDEEWQALRRGLINQQPRLHQVIIKLEQKQNYQPKINNISAMIYDVIYSQIKIFNPSGTSNPTLNKKAS